MTAIAPPPPPATPPSASPPTPAATTSGAPPGWDAGGNPAPFHAMSRSPLGGGAGLLVILVLGALSGWFSHDLLAPERDELSWLDDVEPERADELEPVQTNRDAPLEAGEAAVFDQLEVAVTDVEPVPGDTRWGLDAGRRLFVVTLDIRNDGPATNPWLELGASLFEPNGNRARAASCPFEVADGLDLSTIALAGEGLTGRVCVEGPSDLDDALLWVHRQDALERVYWQVEVSGG